MTHIQIITTSQGDELVVLSRSDYDALLMRAGESVVDEDEGDIAMYDARKLGISMVEHIPAEVSRLMMQGHSRLKAIRLWRDMTQLHIGMRTGLAQSYISELENGHKAGTSETLACLARALDVSVDWIA